MRMAKRTRLCNCWVRRWRWQSRAASSVSLSTKVSRWLRLLSEAAARGIMPDYVGKLLAVFEAEAADERRQILICPVVQPLIEPLSQRELEVLQLIAQGLSNREISERLFLALNTVKGHNRKIFDKLQVQSRTEAVARARELGLL